MEISCWAPRVLENDRCVVELAIAGRDGLPEKLLVLRGQGQREARLARAGLHQLDVLQVLADARVGREVPAGHLLALAERSGGGGGPALQKLEECAPLDAEALGERH